MPRETTSVPPSPYELLQSRNRNPSSGASAATVILDSAASPIGLGTGAATSAEALGASSSATAAVNTAAIQAALTRTGLVTLTTPGTYSINAALVQPSNTDFRVGAGVTIKLAAVSTGPVIKNTAWDTVATVITLAWSAGTLVTVTHTAHGLTQGSYYCIDHISLTDIDQSPFKGVWVITSVTDANTFVVDVEVLPVSSPTTGFVGKAADQNISLIVDGVLDYNRSGGNASGVANTNTVQLAFAQGLTTKIRGTDPGHWIQMVGMVRDFAFDIENVGIWPTSNAFEITKIFGPARHGKLRVKGNSRDDGCSLQCRTPSSFSAGQPCNGDIIDVEVTDVDAHMVGSAGAGLCVLYLSQYENMDGIRIGRVSGSTGGIAGSAGVRIAATDPVTSTLGGLSKGNFGDIRIGTVTANAVYGVSVTGARGKRLVVEELCHNPYDLTSACNAFLLDVDSEILEGEINVKSDIKNWPSATSYLGTFSGAVGEFVCRYVLGADTIGGNARGIQLKAETAWTATTAYITGQVRRPTTNNGFRYECTTAGTSNSVEPTWGTTIGATTADTNGAGAGNVVWTCRLTTQSVVIADSYQLAGSECVDVPASIAAVPVITLRNSALKGTTATIGVAATCTVNFEGNDLSPPSSGLVRVTAGSPTITVRSDGANKFRSGTPVMVNAGTTPVWDVLMPELQVPGTFATAAGGLAEGTNNATIKTANTVTFQIGGKFFTKAATDNLAITAASAQAISTTRIYLVQIDTGGTVTTIQGQAGGTIPAATVGKCPIGAFKVITDGVTTYTAGTTDNSAAGLTVTYVDMATILPACTM